MSQGTLIHGIAASQVLDSSGERIDIDNLDISSYLNGKGFVNYEHKSDTPLQVVGRIISAKKIIEAKDCETEAQTKFWNFVKAPYVYIICELFDSDGEHDSAKAVAAVFKQDFAKNEKNEDHEYFYGFSVEGQTLEKVGGDIKNAVARGVTVTQKPCNKSCVAELYIPESEQKEKDPLAFLKSEKLPEDLKKALTAAVGNAAPSTLSGGAALQNENIDKKLYKTLKDFIESKYGKKPEKEKHDLAMALHDRLLGKAEQEMGKLLKANDDFLDFADAEKRIKAKKAAEPKEPKKIEPLTIGGQKLTPNLTPEGKQIKPRIENGHLHTPRGSIPIHIPTDKEYHQVLNSPEVVEPFKRAMQYYMPVQKLAAERKIPDELLAHSMIHSLLSANNPVPAHEGTFAHVMDIARRNNVDIRSPEFAEGMAEGGKLRRQLKQVAASHKYPEHARDYFLQNKGFKQEGQSGEGFRTLGFLNDFSEKMSRYPEAHDYLKELHEHYGNDARGFVTQFLKDKTSGKLPETHPAKAGFGIAGKTGRYAGLMIGKGNALVNDTHLMRHILGLNPDTDSDAIAYAKDILSRPSNHHLLNSLDEIYQEHPAVRQVQKEYFGGKADPQAIGPGFWRHWLTIAPHERALGRTTRSQQEGTTHLPYWQAAKQILDKHGLGHVFNKSEQNQMPIFMRTALAHKELEDKIGKAPADMIFYGYLAPHLMKNKMEKSDETRTPKKIIKPAPKQEPKLEYSQKQWYNMSRNQKKEALKTLEHQRKVARGEIPTMDQAIESVIKDIQERRFGSGIKKTENQTDILAKNTATYKQMLGNVNQHKEVFDVARKMPNSNWGTWVVRNYKQDPEKFKEVKDHIEHYAGMTHVPAIKDHRFDKQTTFDQGLSQLKAHEDAHSSKQNEGKIDRSRLVTKPKTAKKILDLGNGKAWWSLGKRSCTAEGKAMNHCGNSASAQDYHDILSLRTEHEVNGKKVYQPHATFINDKENNILGEMKGFGNSKPSKYHNEIVELLKLGYIPAGGGYAHESNFHIDDLSPEHKAEVAKHNPDAFAFSSDPKYVEHMVNAIKKLV